MPAPILYCGDTNLDGAASYLAGLMAHRGWTFDYVPSHVSITRELLELRHKLIILSDYPAICFDKELQHLAVQRVQRGAGLLMIGGWESFRGCDGHWQGTPLGDILPVEIGHHDDRVNFPQATLLTQVGEKGHPAIDGLPWNDEPPSVGGLNRVSAREGSEIALVAVSHKVFERDGQFVFQAKKSFPALVLSKQSRGRTAAFLSDVAPHWVGGFVDWGPKRVKAQAPTASAIEVGSYYAQFWQQLLAWVGRLE